MRVIPARIRTVVTGEIYERIFDLISGGHYRLLWDVDQAQKIASRSHVLPKTIPATDLLDGVVTKDLDMSHTNNVDPSQGTVIVAEFPLLPEGFVVIDGNHRVYRAYHMGASVSAVTLNESQMLDALLHDRFRLYYAIHWNISRWVTIEVTGNIPSPYPWMKLSPDDLSQPPLT